MTIKQIKPIIVSAQQIWQAFTFDGLYKNNELRWGCIPHPILFDHNRSLFDVNLWDKAGFDLEHRCC